MTSWSTLLTTLFRSEQRKVEALARRKCADPEQAADVVQDAFMRLSRLAKPEAVNNPGHLLFTTASNIMLDYNRRIRRERNRDGGSVAPDLPCPVPDAEVQHAEKQRRAILREAIAALSDETRDIFIRFHLEGRSYRQIAEEKGMDLRRVEYHLRDAMKACRQYARDHQ